jgi:hypothetical protein
MSTDSRRRQGTRRSSLPPEDAWHPRYEPVCRRVLVVSIIATRLPGVTPRTEYVGLSLRRPSPDAGRTAHTRHRRCERAPPN